MNLLYSKNLGVQEDGGSVGEVKVRGEVGGENALLGDGHTCQVTPGSGHSGGGGKKEEKFAEKLKVGYTHVIASDYVATPGLPVDLLNLHCHVSSSSHACILLLI